MQGGWLGLNHDHIWTDIKKHWFIAGYILANCKCSSWCIKWNQLLELHLPSIGEKREAENFLPYQNKMQRLRGINHQYDSLKN